MSDKPLGNIFVESSTLSGPSAATPSDSPEARIFSQSGLDSEAEPIGQDKGPIGGAETSRSSSVESPKAHLSPTQIGVVQLIDYVRVLVELTEKPVWSLANYGNLALYEEDLRDRIARTAFGS